MCLSLSEILEKSGFEVYFSTDPHACHAIVEKQNIDLLIMDVMMPKIKGTDLLKRIRDGHRWIPVIMMTGYPSIEGAVQSMKYGAANFFVKPLDIDALLLEIRQIINSSGESNDAAAGNSIVTVCEGMRRIIQEIDKVAGTDVPILITGESGTGKELVATEIVKRSTRAERPFIKVNCASIPDTLLESELFGYEQGAFTDAKTRHIGYFEQARDGTIFLDEIGDMSLKTQPKILRVLQDGNIRRIGGPGIVPTNARVISATNRDIDELIGMGTFREDLFYRLSVVTIELPPLRERKADILLLCRHFMENFTVQYGKTIRDISPEVEDIFLFHKWPGNIRELKNCVERAIIFSEGDIITPADLPSHYRNPKEEQLDVCGGSVYDRMHMEIITDALKKNDGIKQKTARFLNIHRKTLYNRMKKLGME